MHVCCQQSQRLQLLIDRDAPRTRCKPSSRRYAATVRAVTAAPSSFPILFYSWSCHCSCELLCHYQVALIRRQSNVTSPSPSLARCDATQPTWPVPSLPLPPSSLAASAPATHSGETTVLTPAQCSSVACVTGSCRRCVSLARCC
jgi:hypothetical protein